MLPRGLLRCGLLPLRHVFLASGGCRWPRDCRYYFAAGKVLCRHPYWPLAALAEGRPERADWRSLLAELDRQTPEEAAALAEMTLRVAARFDGGWSLDGRSTKTAVGSPLTWRRPRCRSTGPGARPPTFWDRAARRAERPPGMALPGPDVPGYDRESLRSLPFVCGAIADTRSTLREDGRGVVRWLDRLEGRCGPVPAWGRAVALVAAGLTMLLAWRLWNAGGRQPPARRPCWARCRVLPARRPSR
jgi:hypothetical protein